MNWKKLTGFVIQYLVLMTAADEDTALSVKHSDLW